MNSEVKVIIFVNRQWIYFNETITKAKDIESMPIECQNSSNNCQRSNTKCMSFVKKERSSSGEKRIWGQIFFNCYFFIHLFYIPPAAYPSVSPPTPSPIHFLSPTPSPTPSYSVSPRKGQDSREYQ